MNPNSSFGGFSFGNAAPPSFGTPATTTASAGLSFGGLGGAVPTTAAPSFGLGTSTSAAPSFGSSFSFGPPAAAAAAATSAATLPTFGASTAGTGFGVPTCTALPTFGVAPTTASLPSFGAATTSVAPPSFGTATSTALPSFGAATAGTGFGAQTTSALPSFGATVPTTSLPSFGAAAPTSSLPSFGTSTSTAPPAFGVATSNTLLFGAPTTSNVPSFGVPAATNATSQPAATNAASTFNLGTSLGPPANLTSTTATTQSVAAPITSQLTFSQIEELINKYTLELEEQEKVFINQATQVNTWDNLLNNNSNKILELNSAVEKVKSDQRILEDELKFIEAQHTELEECITPLKAELDKVPHVDMEKAQTYLLAENLDTQLRQMSEDLKEVIEHLNEINKLQNPNDPIVQIGRILNAHMNSLQWIESTTSQINAKLEDINKMYDTLRRDTERSLRLTYCD